MSIRCVGHTNPDDSPTKRLKLVALLLYMLGQKAKFHPFVGIPSLHKGGNDPTEALPPRRLINSHFVD